ncbi:MAG: AF1514 family protein [Bdellovibrio bacteriovorus]
MAESSNAGVCPLPQPVDWSGIERFELQPDTPLADYRAAMDVATRQAQQRLGDPMLLSWYDRDRDFESPQHASECHQASAVPGYVDYGIHHGATLVVDLEQGRFVFFYLDAAPEQPGDGPSPHKG